MIAHELAHDRYSAGPIKKPKTLRERLYYRQHENFIDKKAAESLMPVHAVRSFLEKHPESTLYDLAEFFNVSEHLAHVRIKALLNEGLL
ncbi:MAG: ImmA/IrrE family metallo-endopeptidase [Actinomycetota bacterium]|nr:ImmA/IrrE family metallo-endopeptidase [Actinomycetota bacterium]